MHRANARRTSASFVPGDVCAWGTDVHNVHNLDDGILLKWKQNANIHIEETDLNFMVAIRVLCAIGNDDWPRIGRRKFSL